MFLHKINHNGIIFELGIPDKSNHKLVLLLPGLPSIPKEQDLVKNITSLGYITVYPRYKGTFESKGDFLAQSPAYEIIELIEALKHYEQTELYSQNKVKIEFNKIIVLASSFGASVALHLSILTKEINKYVLIAPVLDFKKHNTKYKEQDLNNLSKFLKEAFPFVYRFKKKNYKKLLNNEIIPSIFEKKNEINGSIILLHGDKDDTVSIENSKELSTKKNDITLIELKDKGHINFSKINFEFIKELLKKEVENE